MNMTPQQKKALWICLMIFAGYYVFRFLVFSTLQVVSYTQRPFHQSPRKPNPKPQEKQGPPAPQPAVSSVPAPASVPVPTVKQESTPTKPVRTIPVKDGPPPQNKFFGIWRGNQELEARGMCQIRFEVKPKQDQPDSFSGYLKIVCISSAPLTENKQSAAEILAMNQLNPEAAIFTGKLADDGSMQFQTDKVVNTDSSGCTPESFSLTPFGAGLHAADWKEDPPCSGGKSILQRALR